MDYLLLSNWELSKCTYSSEIFNFLKTQVSNTIPSFFLFFILFLFWVTEFSCSTCTIIYRPSSTSQRTSNYPNTTLSRNSFWISSRSTIAPVTIRINSNNSQPFARASQLTDIKRFEIEQNPKAKEKRKPAARSFCNNKETEIEGGGGGGRWQGPAENFSMDRAFPKRRYVLNHRKVSLLGGIIENDRTYYCIATRLFVTRSTDTGGKLRYLVLLGRTKESIVKEKRRHRLG